MSERAPGFSRRDFLRTGAGSALIPITAGMSLWAPGIPVQAADAAVQLRTLAADHARTLLSAARTLFPHDFLGDPHYRKVVAAIDARMTADVPLTGMVRQALDTFPDGFSAMSEPARESYLRSLEGSPFFAFIYQQTILGLYNDPETWTLFGYEGSAIEYGGYLDRGFDDIAWLPGTSPAGDRP